MATRSGGSSTSAPNDADFVTRMVEFRNALQVKEAEIAELKQAFSDAGKAHRKAEQEKTAIMESITKYVLSAQKELV